MTTGEQYELPSGWSWRTVANLAADVPRAITDGPFGSNLKTAHYTAEGPVVIRLQNIGEAEFIDTRAHISEDRFEALRTHEARAGDVIVASLGDALPRACVVPAHLGPAIVKADCGRIRPGAEIDARYLMFALNSAPVRRQAASAIHGMGRQRLRLAELKKLLVPVPPRDEQELIVAQTEAVLDTLNQGLIRLQRGLRRCADFRASCLQHFLVGPPTTIGDVGQVFVGATPSRKAPELWNGDIPWVSSGEVAFCRISRTKETITREGLGNAERRLHSPGTVMLAMIGEGKTRGQAAILDVAAAHNQNSAAIRLDESRMLPDFLYYCLMSQYEVNRLAAGGSQQPALNGKLVRAIGVPCPSLTEQRHALDALKPHLGALDALESRLRNALARYSELRLAVINSAVTGTRDPRSVHSGEALWSGDDVDNKDRAVLVGR